MTGIFGSAMIMLLVIINGCGGTQSLNQSEKEKLDQPLQQALSGIDISSKKYDVSLNPGGTKVYGVIIRTTNSDEVKRLGIQFNSLQGEMMTAKLTAGEIRQVVNLNAVIRIEIGSKSFINQ